MDKVEFIKLCVHCGYANKQEAEQYVRNEQKENYTDEDFIKVHESQMHWGNVATTKGLRPLCTINGKTTAFSNGIKINSGPGQDWR